MNALTMKRAGLAVFLALAFSGAVAETVKKGLPACTTEAHLDELINYMIKKDKAGMAEMIMSGRCVVLTVGAQVSVISPGFMTATIRYNGVKLFTPSEAVR